MTHAEVRAAYAARWGRHQETWQAAAARSRRLSTTRGVTFLAAIGVWVLADLLGLGMVGSGGVLLLAVAGAFVAQVVVHRRVRRAERWAEAMTALARQGMHRMDRDWGALETELPASERAYPPAAPDHPYVSDLDVLGRASLVRLVGPVTSVRARDRVRDWLLTPGTPSHARARQAAVRELAPLEDLRAEYAAHGRLEAPDRFGDPARFVEWAESPPALSPGVRWSWVAWGMPLLLGATVVLDVATAAGPWWLLAAALQIWAGRASRRAAPPTFAAVESAAPAIRALVPQLRLLDRERWEAPALAAIHARLGRDDHAAWRRLARLLRTADTVASRRNLVYATVAPVLLLDLHLLLALDRWRSRCGAEARGWFDAAAEWEALSAFATLAHDHPGWTDPVLFDPGTAPELRAEGLAHPLLHPERCVPNDVHLGPPGRFLLVTGSNMSGKSTLLRALGLNAVLAGAGAPVAARALELPCFRVHTSMRIEDSIEEGVSLFMAELLRIRSVVEAARTPDSEGRPVLFLLDEMLHGTNTAERRVAARGIVQHLLDAGAVGAVSTHDLLLAETPELEQAADPVHFREDVEGRGPDGRPRITFDFRLRPGIATTRNALKLLEAVGLDLPARHREAADGKDEAPDAP